MSLVRSSSSRVIVIGIGIGDSFPEYRISMYYDILTHGNNFWAWTFWPMIVLISQQHTTRVRQGEGLGYASIEKSMLRRRK